MRTLVHVTVASLLLAGCASPSAQSLVVVSVDADAPISDIATLRVRATVGAESREFDVHPTAGASLGIPPSQTFGIDLPHSMSGTLALHVEARDAADTMLGSGDGDGPIRVGARADIALTLTSAVLTSDMGSVDGGADLANVPGDMVVVPPAMLTIDKTTQSFGDIAVGKTSTTASFLVMNAGGMPSSVAMLTTGGANVGEFAIDTDCGPALVPGGRCHVTATVSPTSAGMKTATFTLAATQGGSVGGTLTANALTPGAVKIQQASGDCGSSLIGTQSTKTASFTVQNTGATATSALSVMMSDPQFSATGCSGATLAPNATCSVTVKFTPSARGTQNASLTVSAAMGGSDTASVVGVGLKPASLNLSPASYGFATTPRLSTTGPTETFTLTNDGDVASPTMALATVTGANAGSFNITTDGCQSKQVGPSPDSCTITIQFVPQVTGANGATLNINTSSSTAIMAALTGTGAPIWEQEAAALTLSPLNAVWAADTKNVYAVGDNGTIVYRDPAATWSVRTLSASSPAPNLYAVSGTASTDVYVAGAGIFHSSNSSTWTSWQTGKFNSVFVLGPNDYWGSYYYLDGSSQPVSAIYRFTSSTGWAQVNGANGQPALGLLRLWGTSATDMFSFGQQLQCGLGSCTSTETIVHPDSSGNWVDQYTASFAGPTATINGLWGFGSPATNLFATVSGNVPLHSTGSSWTPMSGNAPTSCAPVWGADGTHLWFGCAGGLYAFDGTTWASPVLTTIQVLGLYGTSAHDVYAVGNDGSGNGVIYHYF